LTEDELIERARRGDPLAARSLYDANVERVFRLAHRITGDPEDAREATQQTFVRAFQALSGFRQGSAFSTWLHAITVSVALNTRRRARRLGARTAPLELAEATIEPPELPDPALRRRLHEAIDALPERMRAVFIMHEIEGFTHMEIAEALGLAEGSCKAHLFRAKEKLRAALQEYAEYWR
jgi:RNA polymerase sigma-70 factor, ECF subfamily